MYDAPLVRFLPPLCLGLAFSIACGDDDASPATDAGRSGIVVLGEVRRAMAGARFEDLGPIEGATVCAYTQPDLPCATTNAVGEFELSGLAPRSEAAITVTATGHRSAVLPFVTDERPVRPSLALEPVEVVDARDASTGASPAPGTGSVGFVAVGASGGLAGVSVTVTPAGAGPYYVDADRSLDTGLTATSERGFGFVLGLPPGVADLRFSHTSFACDVPALGWPDGSNGVRAPVVAGHETAVAIVCEPL